MKKPNIIIFITHDQGHFLGCYNEFPNSLETPNLDKIAKNGIRFTNYFCTAPQCSPSRGSIQTSLYPHQNGLMGLVDRGWTLPQEFKTMPMYLKELGYSTHLIGLSHESRIPSSLGYDTMTERFFSKRGREINPLYNCKLVEKESKKFLEDHKNNEKPFYVSIGVEEVHRPFKIWADSVDPNSLKVPPFLPDNEIVRKELSEYYGAINRVDLTIERIISMLEDTGLNENTLFIYTTDHGSPFPRAKCTLYDPGIETILLMHQPNSDTFSNGKVINGLLSNIDLLPTLIDYIGGELPKNIEGKSFLPLLKQEQTELRSEIYVEKTYHEIYDPIRGIRTNNYKYIRNFENLDTLYQMPAPVLMAPSGKYMKNFYNYPRPTEELYDLRKDPLEKINVINTTEYQEIASDLRKRLFNWLKATNDPILKGKIPKQ
ncbi:MAG: sulfatase [Candidatus Lokiarchaeota archaeon]|nr:sulfatase [Candidatus Lokiarchaeota archaeon]